MAYKEDTLVVDFRNDTESVRKAFNQYYTVTTLSGEVDPQRVYTMKEDVEQWNLFSEEEVNEVCERLIDPKKVSKCAVNPVRHCEREGSPFN